MIALIFGKNASNLVETIKTNSDIQKVDAYDNINNFLTTARQRGYRYERIVMRANTQNAGNDLANLVKYLRDENLNTSVVLAYRDFISEDIPVVQRFWEVFRSPIYTDVSITPEVQVDVDFMVGLCKRSIDSLRSRYSAQVQDEIVRGNLVEVVKETVNPVTFKEGIVKEFKIGGLFRKGFTKMQNSEIKALIGEARAFLKKV